jgi:hypothetical protein
MVSLQALTLAVLLLNGALLSGFLLASLTSSGASFSRRIRMLRRMVFVGLAAVAILAAGRAFSALYWLIPVANFLLFGVGAFVLWRTPKQPSKWTDPASLENYVSRLETELAERRKIERELAFMASIAERDPNCVIQMSGSGDLGYRNPAAEQTFPDLRTLGNRHPIFAGVSDVMAIIHSEGKTQFRRPVRYAERVYEQQITWSAETQKLGLYMTDVTEWKRLDQLKTDLLNTVSHEFRTPLSSILAAV